MRRSLLLGAVAIAGALGMGGALMGVADPAQPTAKPLQQPSDAKQSPSVATPSAAMTNAERRAAADRVYRRNLPTKHKNRAPGERTHRKWRQRRAAGRG